MKRNVTTKAMELLEQLANSILDREGQKEPIYFTITQIHLVETFLDNLYEEWVNKEVLEDKPVT